MIEEFQAFNLQPELLQAVDDLGYEAPSPIQASAIPLLLSGSDVLGQAQTGTGKTAAFALPMLQSLREDETGVQGLVVAPTRELAIQVAKNVRQYAQHLKVQVLTVYGGQSYKLQINQLRRGVDIVVGTPGRMLDLIRKNVLDLSSVHYLVLDEAYEMLSMGFVEDIEAILNETPPSRQTAFFSATLPRPIQRLANRYMHDPESVSIESKQLTVAETEQCCYLVNASDKLAALNRLLEVSEVTSVLIFTRTKVGAAELASALFERGMQAEALHGDLSQAARETTLGHFRRGQINVLVATDVAARGLDIDDISHVINYDIPFDPEAYVHRIGRTGRAGKSGVAITLITPRDMRQLHRIESYTMQPIKRAKLPTVEDVMAYRESQFLQKMWDELMNVEVTPHDLVSQLCDAGYTPEDVAAAAMRLARAEEKQRPIEEVHEVQKRVKSSRKRRDARGHGKDKPRRSRKRDASMVRLAMDAGRAQGIRPGDIVGAIAGEAGIPGRAIGQIDIQKRRTYVDVSEQHVERVLSKMQRCQLRGHAVTLARTD